MIRFSRCDNNHVIENGKVFNHTSFWGCPKCIKERLGAVLLGFIVPGLLYSLIEWNPTMDPEGGRIIGGIIVFIMWWTILGMFFNYREKIKDLKNELLQISHLVRDLNANLNITKQIRTKIKNKIQTKEDELFDEAEKNHSWDDLADYDKKWGANVEKEELLMEDVERIIKKANKKND